MYLKLLQNKVLVAHNSADYYISLAFILVSTRIEIQFKLFRLCKTREELLVSKWLTTLKNGCSSRGENIGLLIFTKFISNSLSIREQIKSKWIWFDVIYNNIDFYGLEFHEIIEIMGYKK